ncbi:heme-degrading monooxygenase HmoA [Rhodoligotrophos appendicifer]|uniref:NIPSNAP family protein n=1 Tax=Rhodoligotrophos appendicifer TaxID=987056 RepID=UPI00147977C5|nr:NIPSNAP family protein [Rhodoligotrophos appendicifer]
MYELRHYVPAPGKAKELRDRFANGTMKLFEKLGFEVVEFWEHADGSGELWYVIEWPDETTMRASWDGFRKNEEWQALKASSEAGGPLTASITSIPLQDVDFFRRS